jgi:hypothetical protein
MVRIQDNRHSELHGDFPTFEAAIAELKRRAATPWDEPPNRAPCRSWRKCGRDYEVTEFDTAEQPWKLLRRVPVLTVSADGVRWSSDFGPEATSSNGA